MNVFVLGLVCAAVLAAGPSAAAAPLAISSPAADVRRGGELRVCDDVAEPMSLNPYQVFSEKAHTLLQQMLEGLVRFGPKGHINPALAESWERVNETTLRFHLRRDVRFHDGEPFDARSVKFSLEKYVAPETHYPGAGFVHTLRRVDVLDDHTVDVATWQPDGLLLNRLAAWMHIVPPEYYARVGDAGFAAHPMGTGPFRFKSWTRGRSIELEANPDYWSRGLPLLDRVTFLFLPPEEQVRRLLDGEADLVTDVPGTQTLPIQSSKSARIIKSPALFTIAASFNVSTGPLRDIRVRQALNYAVNKMELIRYDLLGNGRPVQSLVLDGDPGAESVPKLNPYMYDPAKARGLLRESGIEGNLRLRILEVKAMRAAKIIAAFWKHVGIDAEIVSTTDAQILAEMSRGPWDIVIGSCPDPMVHPFFIQSIFLYSKSPFSLTKSPGLDSMIEGMAGELDPSLRDQKSARLAEWINQNALTLFTYQRIRTYGIRKNLIFEPYLSGMPSFRATGWSKTGGS